MKKLLEYAKKLLGYTMIAALPLALLMPPSAQVNQEQGGMTRQQAEEMLKELRQIRQLLERQQAKAPTPQEEPATRARLADLSSVAMLGSKDAPMTVVEYTDYQCPF